MTLDKIIAVKKHATENNVQCQVSAYSTSELNIWCDGASMKTGYFNEAITFINKVGQ